MLAVLMAGAALLLVVIPLAIPFGPRDLSGRSRALAQDALARIVAAERAAAEKGQRYVPFGPSDAERRAAFGLLDLGPAADSFSFDTLIDRAGRLHVRAVSRAEVVRAGRVAPVLESADLEPFHSSNSTP